MPGKYPKINKKRKIVFKTEQGHQKTKNFKVHRVYLDDNDFEYEGMDLNSKNLEECDEKQVEYV